jgi:hypothetical protein
LLARGSPAHIVRYTYRPFDLRWVYWDPDTKLLDEKRADLVAARISGLPDLVMTLEELFALIGARTLDVYLNTSSFWSNVPEKVWDYELGGYQVVKKWLSYRERNVLGRSLTIDEAVYVSQMVRRIASILLLGPALDANYRASAADAHTYEMLGLSRDAARERKDAKTRKRGISNKLTPAMKANRKAAKQPSRKVTKKPARKTRKKL